MYPQALTNWWDLRPCTTGILLMCVLSQLFPLIFFLVGSRKTTKPVPREVLTQESSNSLVGAEQSCQLPGLPT